MNSGKVQKADLEWRDGVIPVSTRFQDPYFSLNDGLAETEYVFLAGNDLPQRFQAGFHIAELGFGTGLNVLAAWRAWLDCGQTTPLKFTSFEAFPMEPAQMERALAVWPDLAPLAAQLVQAWGQGHGVQSDTLDLTVIIGDARTTLPEWAGRADAWFLDGFSPAKNPELWSPELMQAVADHTQPAGTFATYTAAGHVRSSLSEAGFQVERRKGFGHKRHMSVGSKGN